MSLLLLIALLGSDRPAMPERVAQCDVIEHNTIMQGDDCQFEQVIFWVRPYKESDLAAVHWVNAARVDIRRRGNEVIAVYYENGLRHVVKSKALKETVTDYDPERVDRRKRGESFRLRLFPEMTPTGIDR